MIGLMLVFFLWSICLTPSFQSYASLPSELRLFSGQSKQLHFTMPVNAQVTVKDLDIVAINGKVKHSLQVDLHEPLALQSLQAGKTEMSVRLFGAIPIKTLKVNVIPDLKVIPGGQTIGVKIKSAGILVVGHHLVTVGQGQKTSPAEQADVRLGDLITKVDGVRINDVAKVADLVNAAGKRNGEMKLTILRNGTEIERRIRPALDMEERVYRLGVYIRDSAAGVGTLTFYAPEHGIYGALGHIITDLDTHTPIIPGGGEILNSSVTSISKSQNGSPGEKRAHLFNDQKVLGNIEKNTQFGIFGKMYHPPGNAAYREALPVAFAEDVHNGPAQILTVIDGQKVEKFDIEIVHTSRQNTPTTRGIVIRITDPRLLNKTGGIVQGMSGSPIIQDGKIVGAVTHVLINDPKSGYGCYIEWMLQDAGILLKSGANRELKVG
ncbi:MAG TPA: SpoIVB peptidase [Bacilli bacterium]